MDERNGNVDLFGQRFSPFGSKLWDTDGIPICVYDGNQDAMENRPTATGRSYSPGTIGAKGNDPDIYAQKIDTSGALDRDDEGMPVCTVRPASTSR